MSACLSPDLLDFSSARMSIFQFSNVLGAKFLDTYIGLTANLQLQTELYILSFLLKDRVYPGNLWELVGERSIEAKQEEVFRRHQTICKGGDRGRHTAVERFLMEERRKRCQMEVSLYCQAIEILGQYRFPQQHGDTQLHLYPVHLYPSCVSLACSIAMQEKCEDWLLRHARCYLDPAAEPSVEYYSHLDGSTTSAPSPPSTAHEETPTSTILKRIDPSAPLLSTWITIDVQEAFFGAFQEELDTQAELMKKSLAVRRSNAYLRNLALDWLMLQAKMRRAQAEIRLYTLAIENSYVYESSDSGSSTSLDQNIPRPLLPPQAARCYHDVDADDDVDFDGVDVDGVDVDGVDVDGMDVDNDADLDDDTLQWLRS
ncbi:hypothetical protein M405DRAFT_910793 [Rhizopogon salebrosus TDB-379]|nr:hypothetical protein M405DRAFT_910793 [Rhizopogon salebrosus TDB-379]